MVVLDYVHKQLEKHLETITERKQRLPNMS